MKQKEKQKKDTYTYRFADGSESVVRAADVGQRWIDLLHAMDDAERKGNYNYNRHNYPFSAVDYEGDTFIDENADPHKKCVCNLEQEEIDAAVAKLSKRQREVFELRYYEKLTQNEIAAELGITQQAVAAIYERAEKKLQRIFGKTVVFSAFSSLYSENTSEGE